MKRVKVTIDRTGALAKALKELAAKRVLVGIPSSTATREPDPEDPTPMNNAAIGYLMENGSPAQNLPERAHLKPGVASVEGEIADRYKAGAKALLDGRLTDVDVVHHTVGLVAENAVKRKITDGPFVPLSARTLAARKRKGRTGDKPLIDTGAYRNAITHVIRPRGKKD